MADADGAFRVLVTLAVAVIALAFPFVASGYHIYQGSQVLILAIALLGLNLLTGFNGQISLGHGAFFAIGGYGAAILIMKFGLPFWAAIPLASVVCFRRRLPVRLSRAQVRRPLSRARHFRACGRHAPDPELHRLRRLHRRLAGTFAPQAARAAGAQAQPRPMALPRLPRLRRGALLGGAEPGARADRTGADRHPRPADRRRDDGRQCGALQDDVLRRQRALCRRGGGIERDRRRLRFARELRAAALARFSGRDRGRRPRVARRRAVRRPVHRIRAQSRRPALGQFRRERQGAAGGDLRRAADSGNGRDADGSSGRGAGGGERRFARARSVSTSRS